VNSGSWAKACDAENTPNDTHNHTFTVFFIPINYNRSNDKINKLSSNTKFKCIKKLYNLILTINLFMLR